MAPLSHLFELAKRDFGCPYGYYRSGNVCLRSGWYSYGRWILLAVIIIAALFFFLTLSCVSARRRRRHGMQPFYGTQWMAPPKYSVNNPHPPPPPPPYNPGQAPPPQQPQYTGQTFNSNEGYYGHHEGIQLQQPQNSYYPTREADNVYQAPEGPPPAKR